MKSVLLLGAIGAMLLSANGRLAAQAADSMHASATPVKNALDLVVSQQLEAFRAGDFTKAYSFAAGEIHKLFPPDTFAQMVKEGYPIMLEKAKTDFGTALDDGHEGVLFLELTGAGGTEIFRYSFKMEEGKWKITGVQQEEKVAPSAPAQNTA